MTVALVYTGAECLKIRESQKDRVNYPPLRLRFVKDLPAVKNWVYQSSVMTTPIPLLSPLLLPLYQVVKFY